MVDNQRFYGVVQEFSRSRGNGTIEMDGGNGQVFVRYSSILGEGLRSLHTGQRVSFEVEEDKRGLSALRVMCCD
ncbi:cold-shock protein [Chloroflexota bacterium]